MSLLPTLFDSNTTSTQPLSYRMRPRNIEEFVGQKEIRGSLVSFFSSINDSYVPSCIFSGPPGCGKTTLANLFSLYSKSVFITLNAAFSTLSELKSTLDECIKRKALYSKHTVIFIDEAHRLNKQSQDALLSFIENGTISFVAATTENPYYTLSNALRSRCRIFSLKPLDDNDIKDIVKAAIDDKERGLGNFNIALTNKALDDIALYSQGDGRTALNILENTFNIIKKNHLPSSLDGYEIKPEDIDIAFSSTPLAYDKNGSMHYEMISAFIKSVRGSDPDAALFYLFAMLERGEDPLFIFRRMLILAAEDIGLADPQAITLVTSCQKAFEEVGLPEGEYHLSFAALYLSLTYKSNSVGCFHSAKEAVKNNFTVPRYLVNTDPEIKNYQYPHDFYYHYTPDQQYLPASHFSSHFYSPGSYGFEKKLAQIHAYRQTLKSNSPSPQSPLTQTTTRHQTMTQSPSPKTPLNQTQSSQNSPLENLDDPQKQ